MSENTDYLKMFARFPVSLNRFLQKRLTLEQAKQIIRERMEHRQENFLQMVERNIYNYPSSPYLRLLQMAGCELGDLRVLVKHKGVEDTLRQLRAEGVYITFEEFKGRKPIERNGITFSVQAEDFDNPSAQGGIYSQTGGSTGKAKKIAIDLDDVAARAANRLIALSAQGLLGAPNAIWRGILPDRTFSVLLFGALTGNLPDRWFSNTGLRDSKYWVKYGLGTYYLLACMRLAGLKVPFPEYMPDQPLFIARWIAETVKRHGRCLMRTNVSRGVRLSLAAQAAGIDLTGATLVGGGEPATSAKVQQITRSGARFISNYGMSEAGQPGTGCAQPLDSTDVHLFKDRCVLFTHPHHVQAFDMDVPAFNLTTLLVSSSKVMLNVQVDDYGIVEERHCGCELDSYGFTTHLRQIRSYSKLTGEGVTLIGTELVHILEHVLPARFGGSPLDYQLMEEEDTLGFTRLSVIISPRVEIAAESAVISCLMDALRQSSPTADATRIVWQGANTIQVKRMEPIYTRSGKLLPLYIPNRYANPA